MSQRKSTVATLAAAALTIVATTFGLTAIVDTQSSTTATAQVSQSVTSPSLTISPTSR